MQGLVVLTQSELGPGRPDGEDTRLRRVDHGAEATDSEHPQVRYTTSVRNGGGREEGMGQEAIDIHILHH